MSNRYSNITLDKIDYNFWLAFDKNGGLKMTRGQPVIDRNERAIAMSMRVPRSLFATPQLKATILIEDPGIPRSEIDVTAAAEALKSVLGVDIDLQITNSEMIEGQPHKPL